MQKCGGFSNAIEGGIRRQAGTRWKEVIHLNTKISYLYRDADNYKVHNECVVQGEISEKQIRQILDCCDMGEYFIPRQVGMPERKFDEYDTEADHCWFELSKEGFEYTKQPANVSLTVQRLAENFAVCRNNWKDAEYAALDETSQGFGMELHGL